MASENLVIYSFLWCVVQVFKLELGVYTSDLEVEIQKVNSSDHNINNVYPLRHLSDFRKCRQLNKF